jgi:hypothetical protein
MPAIHNPNRTLRFSLELADFAAKDSAFVCTAAVEFFDRRDNQFWPIVQLPVLRMSQADGHALTDAMRGVCDMSRPGFSFRTGAMEELQLQLGREPSGVAVEVGFDLAAYLMESAGVRSEPGRELALFRFSAELRELVVFGDGIEARIAQLEGRVGR